MKNSSFLNKAFVKAYNSGFYLWLLNLGVARMVPFNKPHKFKILNIEKNLVRIKLPYIKRNMNHVRGIHACALATLSELTTGLLLLSRVDPSKYRIIMKRLEIDFSYQAKMDVWAEFRIEEDELMSLVKKLETEPQDYFAKLKVFNKNGEEICESGVHWQLKSWDQVKTRM